MQIVIRLAGGEDISHETEDPERVTLRQLRELVRERRGGTTVNRQLRFFCHGHALDPAVDFAPGEEVRDRIYIHCFLGRILSPDELAREANDALQLSAPQPSNTPEAHGFDRLRGMGFSDEDVQVIRQQFSELHGATGDEQEALEDAWIDNGDMSRYSSRVIDMLCITLGVFGGAWVILLYRFHLFSRRQYMTIMMGVSINLVFSMLQYLT